MRERKKESGGISNTKWLLLGFPQGESHRCAYVVVKIPSPPQQQTGAPIAAAVWVCGTSVVASFLVYPVVRLTPVGTKEFLDRCLGQTLRPDCLHSIATMYNYLPGLAKGVGLALLAEEGLRLIFEGIFCRRSALALVRVPSLACSDQTKPTG